MYLIILIILLVIVVSILSYIVYNLARKNEILEIINNQQSEWIDDYGDEIKQVYSKLKAVDNRNLFERDDDVGFAFSEILRITKEFDEEINNYETVIREKAGKEINEIQFKSEEPDSAKRIETKLKKLEKFITSKRHSSR